MKLFCFTIINYLVFGIFNILAVFTVLPIYIILSLFTSVPFKYTELLAFPFFKLYILAAPGIKKVYKKDYRKNKIKPTIYISNHQSILDMMIIHAFVTNFATVAKSNLANKFPLNLAIKSLGAVFLNEKDIVKLKLFYENISEIFKKKSSILIFPEGTRMLEEKIGDFHKGAFKFAMDYAVPITPIVIFGTIKIIKKNKFLMETEKPENIFISILEPIDPARFKDLKTFLNFTKEKMEEEYFLLKEKWYEKSKKII
jgi:1-acyl-sn-glycerol-3-phosphate acyltransferase